jgi:hypothetical protein
MSSKVGLGNVPKGLAWIAQRVNNPEQAQTQEELYKTDMQTAQAGATQLVQELEQSKQTIELAKELTKPESVKSAQAGLPTGWIRSTMIMKEDHLDQLKILASLKGVPLKELLAEALSRFLASDDVKKTYMQELEKRYRV